MLNFKGELPQNCNELAIKHASQFRNEELLRLILLNQKKKFYGETIHLDEEGKIDCIYNFTRGICTKAISHMYLSRNINKGTVPFYDTSKPNKGMK